MSELSDYAMRLLMNLQCENCGHEQPDSGKVELCEKCGIGELQDRAADARECLLAESIESDIVKNIGETSKLDYLLKLEKFFDERDLYLYQGWEDAQIVEAPKVTKFWVTLDLRVSEKTELKGALRCCNGEESQNSARYKQLEDGSYYVRFKILRRILDKIEMDAKDKAEDIADDESEV
jgi:hypothetical protein